MSSELYEIIELSTGEIALRRAAEEGEPLVVIKFSEESLHFLKEGKYDVAKAMIEAGMEAAGDMAMSSMDGDVLDADAELGSDQPKILH